MNNEIPEGFVRVSQKVCLICGTEFDGDTILLNKRLRPIKDEEVIEGWGICPEHQAMLDDGYIVMVAIDGSKSNPSKDGNIKPKDAYRTGALVFLKRTIAEQMFDATVPEQGFVFCDDEVIDRIKKMSSIPEEQTE